MVYLLMFHNAVRRVRLALPQLDVSLAQYVMPAATLAVLVTPLLSCTQHKIEKVAQKQAGNLPPLVEITAQLSKIPRRALLK